MLCQLLHLLVAVYAYKSNIISLQGSIKATKTFILIFQHCDCLIRMRWMVYLLYCGATIEDFVLRTQMTQQRTHLSRLKMGKTFDQKEVVMKYF
jgi:hypothetical protein